MFNNAGINGADVSGLLDNQFSNFRQLIDVDLFGVIIGTQRAARHMAKHGGGAIINTSSIAGSRPGVGFLAYRAAKAGVVHFTKCAAVELGGAMIRVNYGGQRRAYEREALKRQGVPADIAHAAMFWKRPVTADQRTYYDR